MIRAGLLISLVAASAGATLLFFPSKATAPTVWDAQTTAIINAIDQNVLALGNTMIAGLQCVDSFAPRSYVDGQLKAKGTSQLRMSGGSTGTLYRHHSIAYVNRQPNGHEHGLRWVNSSGYGYANSANLIGLVDIRVMLWLVRAEGNLATASELEMVNGVSCKKLHSPRLTFWVDASASHRIVRFRYESIEDDARFESDMIGWLPKNGNAEFPSAIQARNYSDNGATLDRRITYTLSNFMFGQPIDDSEFETWDPGDFIPPQ